MLRNFLMMLMATLMLTAHGLPSATRNARHAKTLSTCQGYSNSYCTFPFEYNGVTYNECTDVDHTQCWCAHDPVYQPGRWSNCGTGEGQEE